MHGLRWMVALHSHGLSGILADDMGLGKTVQVISLVAHLVEQGQAGGRPFLVAAPASVLPNWVAEFKRWAPGLKVVVYRGGPEARETIFREQVAPRRGAQGGPAFNVLLTTYDYLMGKADRPRLASFPWCHIIVDEGHRLKDASCKLAQELALYKSRSRLLLTGTPLQNR
ncbi:SNF2 family N-terminal domain-containing protein, partial [Haematococcus lacustris]